MSKKFEIIYLRRHGVVDHVIVTKTFEEEMNCFMKEVNERKTIEKKPNVFGGFI
jgi:hypothetical protein